MAATEKLHIAFLLDHNLMEYRLPFFQELQSRGYDIEVFHSGQFIGKEFGIKNRKAESKKALSFEYKIIPSMKCFDIVVVMQNLRMLNLWLLTLNPFRKYKIIHWGIGVSSAKGLSRKRTLMARARDFISFYSDAIVLYSDFAKPMFCAKNLKKIFIANNTIFNPHQQDLSKSDIKDSFLFIGTLNKRKGLDILISAFADFLSQHQPHLAKKLVIIGDGSEKSNLIDLVHKLGLNEEVIFLGKIEDYKLKQRYFQRALVSISPKQAGLSVLESFSFGVPFIAFKNAISGGEHLNIKNGFNGFLVHSKEELTERMIQMDANPALSRKLGSEAFNYYVSKRTIEKMADEFIKVFKSVS